MSIPDGEFLRAALVLSSRRLVEIGLNSGTVGNLSVRYGDGMLITPTGVPPADMTPGQIVEATFSGAHRGSWRPSSEWKIHARLYETTLAAAVVHAHPDYCVALSCLHRPIPPFHYMVAGFGGDEIPCAGYATFGSPALAESVVDALGMRHTGCLLASHGIVTIGSSLAVAVARAEKLESLARQYTLALAVGDPVVLTPAELADVHARYNSYGVQPAQATPFERRVIPDEPES